MKEISYRQAIYEAIDEEMTRDPLVFMLGEDIGKAWGAALGELKGLFDKYGPKRIRETPITETVILGGAIGAAATGMRPIAFLFFNDFLGVCGDELLNQLQMKYMYGGQIRLPLTILVYTGAGVSAAHQHSKSIEGLLLGIKGLKIALPSTPRDMKGLLKSAVREDNPVIILEHKGLILSKSTYPVPDGEYTIPLGEADIKREGKDVTVVATQLMVHRALKAAETLQAKGISIEVIDPRTLVPFDKQTIIDSVEKTGRLVIMTEEPKTGSAAGEIMSVITEEAFDFLNAPVKRVCAPDTPIPFSPVLEKFYMPDEENLIQAISEIM